MKQLFIADDGKRFDKEEDCRLYEDKIKEDERRRKQRKTEENKRLNEVSKAFEDYKKLSDKFYSDYGYYPVVTTNNTTVKDLFDILLG